MLLTNGGAKMIRARPEKGQALIVFILVLTVIFMVGAISVDVGLWLSERRGSQKDADVSALSGAWELIDPGAVAGDAQDAAGAALTDNDQQLNASFVSPPSVDLDERCVSVDVRHQSRGAFFGVFGIGTPDIGAHARACAGAANAPNNLVPFEMENDPGPCFDSNQEPLFTSLCPIEAGAHGSNPRGILDLQVSGGECSDPGGAGDIAELIEFGAKGTCLINTSGNCDPNKGPWFDCVASQTGNPKKVIDGTAARLAKDGDCDATYGNHDGVDDFSETVEVVFDTGDPYTSIYDGRDCDPSTPGKQLSPRLVTLIIVEDAPPKNGTGEPILAFAGFYLAGCADENVTVNSEADLDRYCQTNGAAKITPNEIDSDLYVSSLAVAAAAPRRTLTVIVNVVGGGAAPGAFTIGVSSEGNPVPSSFPGAASPGTAVLIDQGEDYTASVTSGLSGYVITYSSGCSGELRGANGATCTITATRVSPTPTPVPTPTPGGATPTPAPTPSPTPNPNGGCTAPGQCVVYGRFVNIILSGGGIGPITDQTTAFGIALVE